MFLILFFSTIYASGQAICEAQIIQEPTRYVLKRWRKKKS